MSVNRGLIMVSVSPMQARDILKDKQTSLLHKSIPKDFVGWVYMYVTKRKPYLHKNQFGYQVYDGNIKSFIEQIYLLNGKVVARWWHDECEKIPYEIILPLGYENEDGIWVDNSVYGYFIGEHINKKSLLGDDEIEHYGNGKDVYAWHIKQLEIFDKPMELKNFYTYKKRGFYYITEMHPYDKEVKVQLTKSPTTWQHVWIKK